MISRKPLLASLCVGVAAVSTGALTQELTNPFAGAAQTRPGTVEVVPATDARSSDPRYRQVAAVAEQQRTRGWVEVDEHKASTIDRAFELPAAAGLTQQRSVEPLLNSLRLAPASVGGTMLERATLEDVRTAGGFVNGGWTGLVRLFTVPDLGRAVLEEYDYIAAGSHFRIPEETVDMSVNGYPAIYRVYRAPTGKGYTEFAWFTGTKHFRLMIDGQIAKSNDAFVRVQRLMETLI